jgi:hypothetical protein
MAPARGNGRTVKGKHALKGKHLTQIQQSWIEGFFTQEALN